MNETKRAIVVVLDSAGVGYLPDAAEFGDVGADTFGHIIEKRGLDVPNLASLGLYRIPQTSFFGRDPMPDRAIVGRYGKAAERTKAKDTTSGHWELMGHAMDVPFRTFPNGFPSDFLQRFEAASGYATIGNCVASGTAIIQELGNEMVAGRKLIVYTSADSVFQVAAHEDVVPPEELYRVCQIARDMLQGDLAVGRVIARPFEGSSGAYKRTERRRDFSLPPERDTVLDGIAAAGLTTLGIGKIEDIFCNRGLTKALHTTNNHDGTLATIEAARTQKDGLIFTNLVDTDMLYGHRNDVEGYALALEAFDRALPVLMDALRPGDLLIVTADHGCDPAFPGTDHTREYIPILSYQPDAPQAQDLGIRATFADVGATVYRHLGLGAWREGRAF